MLRHWARVGVGVVAAYLVALIAILLLGALVDHWVRADGSTGFDRSITSWAVDQRSPGLTSVMRQVTRLGSATVLAPLTLVVVILLAVKRRVDLVGFVVVALIGGLLLADLAKAVMDRTRPPVRIALDSLQGLSFPSGHSTQAMATYVSLAVVVIALCRPRALRFAALAGAIVVALLVGASRVYLGVHWATDVIGGWFLGAVWIAGLTTVLYRLHLNAPVVGGPDVSAAVPEPRRE